jgi:tetratricopeptide (TPR) repeat protein
MDTSDLASFGELLKTYRKRRGLTQQQVARQLALHHNTIGAWERGDYLPATRGMILELARCLHLSEAETQALLEASLTAVTPRWSVPYQRNPFFTGRQATLQQLHSILAAQASSTGYRACVLSGLGGIGKTQTALEYAHRHALDYAAVFWVNAETEEGLLSSFAAIARILKLLVSYTQKQEEVVTLVLDWLNTHQNWLLIFDNVEQRELVKGFVPCSPNGSLLFTTRLPTLGTLASSLELQPLPLEESFQLLLKRAGVQPLYQPSEPISGEEAEAAHTIARTLDGLPLALDQAAAYIEESHCRFVGFLSLFHYDALHMLQEHPSSATYPRSVEKTFTMAFERLKKQNSVAADVLMLCCFLAPDEIPEALLIKGNAHLDEELRAALSNPSQFQAIFKDLLAYALLRRNTQAETLSMHRLVQTVLKERLPEEVQRTWVDMLIRMLDQLFLVELGRVEVEHWSWCEQVLPHAQSVLQAAENLQLVSRELGALLQKIATYLFHRARYEQAEALYLRAISIQKQALGATHPDLVLALTGLANTHHQQGKYQEVEVFYQEAISLIEVSLGPEHPQLALPLQGLAFFYQETTQYAKAEATYRHALHVCTQASGPDHPDLATILHYLASCYLVQGYYTQAEPLCLQALQIRERTLHPHHPSIGETLNDLALLYYNQTRYQESEQLYLRSLSLKEQTLGIDHPDVASTLNNLARLYCLQARYEEAEPLYQRALSIRERVFGANHPYTAFFVHNLAALYCDQGRYKEAEAFATRALATYEQKLDASSHIIASPLHNLAQVAYKQKHYAEAEVFAARALAILERTLPDHPLLAETLHLYANIQRMQGSYAEAEQLDQRALHMYQKALGPESINVAMLMDDFAMLYQDQRRWEEAEQRQQEALHLWERYQELNHPAHTDCLEHYASLLDQQQRRQEATAYRLRAQDMRGRRQIKHRVATQHGQAPMKARDEKKAIQSG